MKDLKILGTGCAKCDKLAAETEAAALEMGLQFTLEKVQDINAIMSFGVMLTPALVVDGDVKCVGKVPSLSEIKLLLA